VALRIRPGTAEAIVAAPDRFALEVDGADDPAAALAALGLVRTELVGLVPAVAVPRVEISRAVLGPAGPLLLVEHLEAPAQDLDGIPDLVCARLADLGVTTATVGVPRPGGPLDGLATTAGCVVLRLFPGGERLPARWLDLAVDWIDADLDAHATVATRVLSVEHPLAAGSVADLLHDCGVAGTWCDVVTGDLGDRIRTASLTFGRLPHLALAAGGPAVDRPGLVARFSLLQEVAREVVGEVAYACLDVEPTFEGIGAGLGGVASNRVAAAALDRLVPGAYPWQVVGAGPAARLVASGEPPEWREVGAGRVEIALGDPLAWLPHSMERADAHEIALDWLAPALGDDDEVDRLVAPAPSEGTDVPDLQGIVLRATPTAHRSTRLTAMELTAWLAHEHHSDAPITASPVLATFVRLWSAGLDDVSRQGLKPRLERLVGTAGDGPADRAWGWAMVDWLVRVHAAAWLGAAGPDAAAVAAELAAIGPLDDRGELGAAVEVLAAFLVAGDRSAGADDGATWEAWESVRDAAGWSAASEAAAQGGSPAAAEAADLVVIDAARRGGSGTTAAPLVEDAWQAALRAVVADGWEQAWRAADRLARDRTGLTIRIEMGRVAKAAEEDRAGAELDAAERAALASLVDAVVDPAGTPDPWTAANAAARASVGGATWASVVDGSRDAIGDALWGEAMAAAAAVVDEAVALGAETAARAVAAALAREVSGLAARSMASGAAGAWDEPSERLKSARDALAVVAAELVESAFVFLDSVLPTGSPGPPDLAPPSARAKGGG
jgi:hypothetical protein